jgi:hypothetical protein
MTFALATLELVLENLLYHFNWEPLHGTKPEDLDLTETLEGLTARKKSPLLLCAQPYIPA